MESLICTDCLLSKRRENLQVDMAEIADMSGALVGVVQSQVPNKEYQLKALLYAAAAILHVNELEYNDAKIFLNGCVYEFEELKGDKNDESKH
jgi:hypothetical protein